MSRSRRADRQPEAAAAAEAYRILRSSVKFAAGERPVRSVLVVDVDRERPSGVAEQLARSFAASGDRCAFVDSDVRQADPDAPGLTDLIVGTVDATAISSASAAGEPSRIGPGSGRNPDLLADERLSVAIDAILQRHDIAVISAASLPAYGDALAIAPRVDATILVVTSGRTRRPRAIEARDALERVGARILGVVMVETKRRLFW